MGARLKVVPAEMYYNAKLQKRIFDAMTAVAGGRKVNVTVDSYGYHASLAMLKTNGKWATTMIPTRYNPADPSQADQQMLQFMGFLPKEFKVVTPEDAIAFAQLWTEEHCED